MTEKTGYKYSIKFSQSLTSGTIAFEGYYAFDTIEEFSANERGPIELVRMLQKTEERFTNEGYKVASIVPNNLKQLANTKPEPKKPKYIGEKVE